MCPREGDDALGVAREGSHSLAAAVEDADVGVEAAGDQIALQIERVRKDR